MADLGISVVVPIIKDKWLGSLLKDIAANTLLPDEIIVIDNSPDGCGKAICDQFPGLAGRYLRQSKNIGVNPSWNLGVAEAKHELVCILNDDLILPAGYFEGIKRVFSAVAAVGLLVPRTEANQRRVGSTNAPPALWILPQRQGWAFTVRKSAWTPIPSEFVTWCGDDFIYEVVKSKGYWCVGDANQRIYHHVGISLDVPERAALNLPSFENERVIWNEMKARQFNG